MSERIEKLRFAVEQGEKCQAEHLESIPYRAGAGNEVVWEGIVEVFKVTGIPNVAKCFAWDFNDGTEDRVATVLKKPPVHSVKDAVTFWLGYLGHSQGVKVSDPH